jgi:Spy/CpxP family protein refolding chaperone
MKTVRMMLIAVAVVLLATTLFAQDQAKEKAKAGKLPRLGQTLLTMERVRSALEQLDLSDEQKEKLKAIRDKAGPRMKEVWETTREILNEEQTRAAGESLKQARDAGKKGGAVIEALLSALKLTDEQKEKLLKLEQESLAIQRELTKEIVGVLTPEQQEKFQAKMRPDRKKGAKAPQKNEAK